MFFSVWRHYMFISSRELMHSNGTRTVLWCVFNYCRIFQNMRVQLWDQLDTTAVCCLFNNEDSFSILPLTEQNTRTLKTNVTLLLLSVPLCMCVCVCVFYCMAVTAKYSSTQIQGIMRKKNNNTALMWNIIKRSVHVERFRSGTYELHFSEDVAFVGNCLFRR